MNVGSKREKEERSKEEAIEYNRGSSHEGNSEDTENKRKTQTKQMKHN